MLLKQQVRGDMFLMLETRTCIQRLLQTAEKPIRLTGNRVLKVREIGTLRKVLQWLGPMKPDERDIFRKLWELLWQRIILSRVLPMRKAWALAERL